MGSYFWWRATARANGETCSSLGIGHPKRLIINAILLILAIVVIKFIGVTGRMNEEWRWAVAVLVASTIFYIPMFVWNLFKAPGHMEKEADKVHRQEVGLLSMKTLEQGRCISILEEQIKPKFIVKPNVKKPSMYEAGELSSWADLEITNGSSSIDLPDVSVKILRVEWVLEKRDEEGKGIGKYFLHEPTETWNVASVYWSGITGEAQQFDRPIHPNEVDCATIAYHHKRGGGLGVFNTRTYPPLSESKIVVEVSSLNSNVWKGEYYIAYYPQVRDEFEFIEWTEWLKTHELIEP